MIPNYVLYLLDYKTLQSLGEECKDIVKTEDRRVDTV
jgi:hypothetical protein